MMEIDISLLGAPSVSIIIDKCGRSGIHFLSAMNEKIFIR